MKTFAIVGLLSVLASTARAEIEILPKSITLTGAYATQQLLVEQKKSGKYHGDSTKSATFSSSNPNILRVDSRGKVQGVRDGEAVVTARIGNHTATTRIRVEGTQKPFLWSFRNHVLPILTKSSCNSGACHGAAAGKGGLRLTLRGYDPDADYHALTHQAGGRRTIAFEPEQSLLLLKPTMQVGHAGGKRMDRASADYRVVGEWIKSGVPQPRATDPKPIRLEVFPEKTEMAQGATQQIVVRAHYSDGHTEDVTRWVKFGTSESSVATVDDLGKVTMQGVGEAAITVWFSSKVTFARVYRRFPNNIRAGADNETPGANFIDVKVQERLKSLALLPSQKASDTTFIRRAYLDACGVLPTLEETHRFDMDNRSDKRTLLVDALLRRTEFVDYWAYKWSDLLLVNSKRLSGGSLVSFSGWIRKSVQENKPWNRFVQELLTAQGSTLENGAANYFVLHKEPIDLTETTTQAFLGMSLTCARCHNHPMERWTQKDYYQLANLFSRVRLKNGERGGEVLVLAETNGEINHPRLGVPLPPRPLDGTAISLASQQDRREVLSQWLTAPENPYFAKALVNRVWRNFMGRGLVEAEDDLRLTNPPSNPELLEALAKEFVQSGYDVKNLIRTIMLSNTYQRDAVANSGNSKDDRYYSRYIVKRLPAEVLLDAASQVTGIPTAFEGYAKGTRALQLPDSQVASYFLTTFGRPERNQTCACERQQEPNIAQALHLSNGDTLNDKLKAEGGTIDMWLKEEWKPEEFITRLYGIALSRKPTDAEMKRILPLLATPTAERAARRAALEDLFWSVLTSKEFLFNH